MSIPRTRRRVPAATRRQRGQVLVIVALMGVALFAIAGLAIDGGMELGKYREAQNAADAGALAAARLAFNQLSSGQQPTTTDLDNAATAEIHHNGANPGTADRGPNAVLALLGVTDAEAAGPSGSAVSNTNWQLQPCSTATAEGQLADFSVSNVAGSTVLGHIADANHTATAAGTGCTASASGQISTARMSAGSTPASVNCWYSSSGTTGQTACSDVGNLPALAAVVAPMPVSVSASLDQGTTQSSVTAGDPVSSNTIGVTTLTGQAGSVTYGASLLAQSDSTLTPVGGGYLDRADTVMSNGSATVVTTGGNVVLTTTSVTAIAQIGNNNPSAKATCGAGTTITVGVAPAVPLNSDCSVSSPLPTLLNTFVQTDVYNASCSRVSPGWLCSASACVMKVTVTSPQPAVSLCLGEATATMAVYQPTCGAGSPVVTSVSPSSGPTAGGTSVTVNGSGFSAASAVRFGTASAAFTVVSDGQITAVSPAQSAGTVDVLVTASGLTSCPGSPDRYTYGSSGGPIVTSVSPGSGPPGGGTSVTISGSGFSGVTSVRFGTVAATFSVNSDGQISATSPAESSGIVDVTVKTAGDTSPLTAADQFTFAAGGPGPVVTSISPGSGPTIGGTPVTISGGGFTGATSVHFGAVAAAFSVASDGQVNTTSPPGSGTVDVTVTTVGGTSGATLADRFTYGVAGSSANSVQGWTATANVQSSTYLLGLLGWLSTHPAATATARICTVSDESDDAFAAAPYAMPDMATRQDGGGGFEKLVVGHQYYLWGALMSSYSPVAVFGTTWQGKTTATNGHGVGSTLTADTSVASGPGYYLGGGSYYLLPVLSQTGAVEYYAEFLPVAGFPHLGLLVNSVPASGGHIVEATPGGGWQPDDPGAVVLRLTQ